MRCLVSFVLCGVVAVSGCSMWDLGMPNMPGPDVPDAEREATELVGHLAVPFGMFPVQVEGVGIVVGLRGTGSDPQPDHLRAALVADMKTRNVAYPNAVLASSNTALVKVRGVLRPGIQKGDHFDVEIRIPAQSDTTSLRGGHLLEVRLSELAKLDGQVHSGHYLARAEGPVMVDPSADPKGNRVLLGRGRVLGGGVCLKNRPMALVLKPEHKSAFNAARIAAAVNKRFHTFQKGVKVGVAKAKTDEYLELAVHPRYKDNIERYINVVRAVALRETEPEQFVRLGELEKQLSDPVKASRAALELEALGNAGVEPLKKGLKAGSPEVRFHAAEALAYLDRGEAVEVLTQTARQIPAFRVFALGALGAMNDASARQNLCELLEVPSVETRYGAFRALRAMNSADPLVAGESFHGEFSYHVLDLPGPEMIHVTRNRLPEIVLFGRDQRLKCPLALEAGNQIIVRSTKAGEITVSKFALNAADQKRFVSDRVDEVVRAIVELGGTYPDVVQALQEAKSAGALPGRFEVDALPEAGRTYDRKFASEAETDQQGEPGRTDDSLTSSACFFFGGGTPEEDVSPHLTDETGPTSAKSYPNHQPPGGLFDRILGRNRPTPLNPS